MVRSCRESVPWDVCHLVGPENVSVGEAVHQPVEFVGVTHHHVGQARVDGASRVGGFAGEYEMRTDLTRRPRQPICRADVGKEPDVHLRHPHLRGGRDDAAGGVHGEPHASAHRQPVHERHERQWVVGDLLVEQVLVVPEPQRLGVLFGGAEGEFALPTHIAAGAQAALAGSAQGDRVDLAAFGPGGELRPHRIDHRQVEGVDRPRPVERDDTASAAHLEQHVVGRREHELGHGYRAFLSVSRELSPAPSRGLCRHLRRALRRSFHQHLHRHLHRRLPAPFAGAERVTAPPRPPLEAAILAADTGTEPVATCPRRPSVPIARRPCVRGARRPQPGGLNP